MSWDGGVGDDGMTATPSPIRLTPGLPYWLAPHDHVTYTAPCPHGRYAEWHARMTWQGASETACECECIR